jgi:hypothetical protein
MQVQSHIQGEFWMYARSVRQANASRTRSELDDGVLRPVVPNRNGKRLCGSIALQSLFSQSGRRITHDLASAALREFAKDVGQCARVTRKRAQPFIAARKHRRRLLCGLAHLLSSAIVRSDKRMLVAVGDPADPPGCQPRYFCIASHKNWIVERRQHCDPMN